MVIQKIIRLKKKSEFEVRNFLFSILVEATCTILHWNRGPRSSIMHDVVAQRQKIEDESNFRNNLFNSEYRRR